MRYSNEHLDSGWGRISSEDGSKSVNVFYVLRTAEVQTGGDRNPLRAPDLLEVKELDFRGKDRSKKIEAPSWLWRESTLEAEDETFYRISRNNIGWSIKRIDL
jgi:hypothetical protein